MNENKIFESYEELCNAFRYHNAQKKGFKSLKGNKLMDFMHSFVRDDWKDVVDTFNPFLITFDYKIEEFSGKPYLLELEATPDNVFARMIFEGKDWEENKYLKHIAENPGFNKFVDLDSLIEKWSSFDNSLEISFAPHLYLIAHDKMLTHFCFPDEMSEFVNLKDCSKNDILVQKERRNSQGRGIFIKKCKDLPHTEIKKHESNVEEIIWNDKTPFFERFIRGKPHIENGEEFEVVYRSVYLMGPKSNKLNLEHLTTYARISSVPRNSRKRYQKRFAVNVSNKDIPSRSIKADEEDTELLKKTSEKLFQSIVKKVKKDFSMKDLLSNKKFCFTYSDFRFGSHKEQAKIFDDLFKDWAVFETFPFNSGYYFPRNPRHGSGYEPADCYAGYEKFYDNYITSIIKLVNFVKPDFILTYKEVPNLETNSVKYFFKGTEVFNPVSASPTRYGRKAPIIDLNELDISKDRIIFPDSFSSEGFEKELKTKLSNIK